MAELLSIPGIGKISLELLEAAGFNDAESLANISAEDLYRELDRANTILKIAKRIPAQAVMEKWVASARKIVGVADQPAGPSIAPVNYEASPQVEPLLANAPFAIPLPTRVFVENQLGVSDIPVAILLNRYSGDLDVKISQSVSKSRLPRPSAASGYVQISEGLSPRAEFQPTFVRTTEDMGKVKRRSHTSKPPETNDRVALLRAPRSETNKGRSPNSRWYIRGVLHSHPVSIYFGALVTLALMVMVPLSVTATTLLLLSDNFPHFFKWVPSWLLVIPVLLPLFGIAYLIWGLGGSCRICGQKLFTHRTHLKNSRAHQVWGLGYVLPLCVQIVIFRWFRCTHCGTPVRLKE